MSIRLLRTNPRYLNNPTGFSVRRSGLDWIIADASDKAVPGKRFSSESTARSELAKLDGGAVSMAASPAAPPPPGAGNAAARTAREDMLKTVQGSTGLDKSKFIRSSDWEAGGTLALIGRALAWFYKLQKLVSAYPDYPNSIQLDWSGPVPNPEKSMDMWVIFDREFKTFRLDTFAGPPTYRKRYASLPVPSGAEAILAARAFSWTGGIEFLELALPILSSPVSSTPELGGSLRGPYKLGGGTGWSDRGAWASVMDSYYYESVSTGVSYVVRSIKSTSTNDAYYKNPVYTGTRDLPSGTDVERYWAALAVDNQTGFAADIGIGDLSDCLYRVVLIENFLKTAMRNR